MITLKLSDEQAAALGINDKTDFGAWLQDLHSRVAAVESGTKTFTTAEQVNTLIADCVKANTESIGTLTAKVDGFKIVSEDKVKELANLAAATALGSAGFSPIKPAGESDPNEKGPQAKADELIAAGDYEAAWKASPQLQDEFSTAAVFAAFSKANSRGAVKIFQPKTK